VDLRVVELRVIDPLSVEGNVGIGDGFLRLHGDEDFLGAVGVSYLFFG
jgi:hypothetical protein